MGDGLKLSKDKRHRSSSSIGGNAVEGTRSERKLDLAESIAEVDDQFALAEARCENLQEKIELVKVIKRKKKLKKLSMTRVNEVPAPTENMSFITVKTQPKKKAVQSRQRRLEAPSLDSAAEEQRRMLGQVRGYTEAYYEPQHSYKQSQNMEPNLRRMRDHRARADGDRVTCGRSLQIDSPGLTQPRPTDQDDAPENVEFRQRDFSRSVKKTSPEVRPPSPKQVGRRKQVPRDVPAKTVREKWKERTREQAWHTSPDQRGVPAYNNFASQLAGDEPGERPVVELFNNNMKNGVSTWQSAGLERKLKKDVRDPTRRGMRTVREKFSDQRTGPLGDVSTQPVKEKEARHPHKLKYRCRRYELPTMASQMKQAGARYYQGTGAYPNIPFVVSKSTAPSHNIGVNIQQVLNGLKVQQPLTGIPPTIAHHMGLGHISTFMANNNIAPALSEHREINTIRLGRRLVRLPSHKYMSYNRALNLYREGDGMVPRFLRAISRPHYFYTSMYNSLATTREDLDAATSKGNNIAAQEAKQSLAEYASLYREYEQLDKTLREGNYDPEWERRRDEIWKELALREERVRKMVQDYRGSDAELAPLRASASTTEDGCRRRSCYKLGDLQQ
ncbi:uncharacterized protein LOC134804778 isoform X1 [Cydia splendana]|uniref:uncharacterized protein LOC134804778 isoform X1 n=1 Tax=Cydia splendana TaxID=1100963 RepID=UPI00300D0FA9